MHFAVTLAHDTGWDDTREIRQQTGWDEHAAFMDRLVADGTILFGGPIGDRSRTLHLVDAADPETIKRRFGEDPWARDGLLYIADIAPWSLWLDFRKKATG